MRRARARPRPRARARLRPRPRAPNTQSPFEAILDKYRRCTNICVVAQIFALWHKYLHRGANGLRFGNNSLHRVENVCIVVKTVCVMTQIVCIVMQMVCVVGLNIYFIFILYWIGLKIYFLMLAEISHRRKATLV